LEILKQQEKYSEIEPNHLLETLKKAVSQAIENQTDKYRIKCLGFSTQRNSFALWNKLIYFKTY
jgi:sugar (pentulose or hexulose) kinase